MIAKDERLRDGARRRPEDRQGAGRARGRVRRQPRAMGRPRARPAVGDVGAATGRPAGPRGDLGRAVRRDRGRKASPTSSGPTCAPSGPPRGGTSRHGPGISVAEARRGGEGVGPDLVSRRGRQAAHRPRGCPAARPGHAGTGPFPAPLGRRAAGPCPPDRDPPRGLPPADLRHQERRSRSGPTSSTAAWWAHGPCATGGSSSIRSSRWRPRTRRRWSANAPTLEAFHA